jgi:hypothetical protein
MDHPHQPRIPPTSNDTFGTLYADSQQFNAYDSMFPSGPEASNFSNSAWTGEINSLQSRAQQPQPQPQSQSQSTVPSWGNHLTPQPQQQQQQQAFNSPASPYARSMNPSPASFAQPNYVNYSGQQNFYRPPPQGFPNHGPPYIQSYNSGVPPTFTPGYHSYSRPIPPQPSIPRVDPQTLANQIPKGADAGMFSIINFDHLSRTTHSERLSNYSNVGRESLELDVTRSAIPPYISRKSRNELLALAGNNTTALAKIGKKLKKNPKTVKNGGQDSSSDDDSSDDDSSEYSSDSDSDSPLPSKRPESPKAGVEYDVIKALWRSKRKTVDAATVRKCLVDFWEIIKTIRDRWKADAAAVTDAEEKKKVGELPLLKSRVKDQREMAEAAFKAAIKYGHRGIIEL